MSQDEITYDPTAVSTFRQIWGPDFLPPFPRTPETVEAMAPIAAAQGAVMSNPVLDLKTRALVIFATMVALGYQPEAKLYIQGLRNLGYTVRQIAEIIAQVALYAGMPRGIDANMLLTEVLAEDDERQASGGFFYRFPGES
ncbi:MAG: carboxymuconolactone decarboxylase family protein [Acidimicrobiia bacterium]|nr:carboxymuconolactone decarboxylase family protein [Acidimicrobiia bacterium]